MSRKKELTPNQKTECAALRAIWDSKRKVLGLTQQSFAERAEITPAAVNHYLNGVNALNPQIAALFAGALEVSVGQFSTRLEEELAVMTRSVQSITPRTPLPASPPGVTLAHLLDTSTLRQDVQSLVDDIVCKSKTGELTADQVRILRDSVTEFTKPVRRRDSPNTNQQLRDALRNDSDPKP